MRIKLLVNFGTIPKGTVLPVRKISETNKVNIYQVIDGVYTGTILTLASRFVLELQDKAVYTEKEWNDLENHYLAELDAERERLGRAQEAVKELTKQLANKIKEVDKLTFFIEALSTGLVASCKAIEVLKKAN